MKGLLIAIVLFAFLNTAWAAEPFAIVELFASEGCSSCPPADEVLRTLTQEASSQGKKILTLSFQVDYWNKLGWKDPFSRREFTQRQYQYATVLGTSSVYTPQMIINGQKAFVGSDESKARAYIKEYLKTPGDVTITLKLQKAADENVFVQYSCDKKPEFSMIHFALVERDVQSHVTAGENEGRILNHDHIVRDFKSINLKDNNGDMRLSLPKGMNLEKSSVIVFVQRVNDMKILGAQELNLADNP